MKVLEVPRTIYKTRRLVDNFYETKSVVVDCILIDKTRLVDTHRTITKSYYSPFQVYINDGGQGEYNISHQK